MWIKLLLLLLYFLSLFFVSRLLEAAAWYESEFLSHRILDPFALSVKRLKKLLESRGVNYAGFVEKKELTSLVQQSGDVTEGELLEVTNEEEANASSVPSTARFTSGSHFYEEVEDTKDSVWLVQVVPPSASPLLDDLVWRNLHSRIAAFGVRMGILDCSVDRRLCNKKGWHVPQLILAIPKGRRAKDSVVLHAYPTRRTVRLQLVLDWLKEHLLSRVQLVKTTEELQSEWLSYGNDTKRSEVRLLFFSALLDPPLFLLALGVRFSGRVKVGMVHVKDVKDRDKNSKEMQYAQFAGVHRLPCYLVVTPEKVYSYGQRVGEYFTYKRMECFLKALRPEMNDVFLLSLALVNLFGTLNFLFVEDALWRHVILCVWRLGKANCILFLAWLLILGLGQLTFVEYASEAGLTVVRAAGGSAIAAVVRHDWQRWKNRYPWVLASLFVFCAVGFRMHRRNRRRTVAETTDGSPDATPTNFSEWWSASLDSYLMDCFFRPIATFAQPASPTDLDLEEGMEMLIERLAVPNFWLQPVVSLDYIEALPVWVRGRKRRVATQSSESDEGTTDVASEDESCKMVEEVPEGMLECYECAICLESYKTGAVLCGLPCGHNYHQQCIVPWLSRDNHHCPVCRWPTYKSKSQPCSVRSHAE